MALFDDLQRQASVGPNPSRTAGGAPVPQRANTFINPPAPAMAPNGRPPLPRPSFAGGAGSSLPLTPGTAGAAGSPAGSPQRPSMPTPTPGPNAVLWPDSPGGAKGAGPSPGAVLWPDTPRGGPGQGAVLWPDAPAGGGGGAQPGPGQPVAPAPAPLRLSVEKVPSRAEIASLPPGAEIMTPYGMVGADGRVHPTPETAAAYQAAVVRAQQAYGPHPFSAMPGVPAPPVVLGRANFNAFTGQWVRA